MKKIPISVVMPVYNAEKYLPEAIESILNQTYENFEFIIVDNMSTDKSLEIIRYYAKKDNRIKISICKKRGFSYAINSGIKQARFDWIARMDADDISLPERLEIQVQHIKEYPEIAALGSYGYYMDASGEKILGKIKIGPTSIEEYKEMVQKNKLIFILNVSMIIKKDVFLALGGYRNIPVLEDLDFNCRMAQEGYLAKVIPKYLVKVRKLSTSETSSKFFLAQNVMRWIKYSITIKKEGKKEPSLEEFLNILNHESKLKKINRHRKDLGAFYFKKAGLAISYKKYLDFIFLFIISLLLNPNYVLKKIKSML